MHFQSASPSAVKSIKQRDLLNTWLRLYARNGAAPRMQDFRPERMADEMPDLVYISVDQTHEPPVFTITDDGARMAMAFGNAGKGRLLHEYFGTQTAAAVMPIYFRCVARALPVYTIALIDDIYGRTVNYERLLLPFADGSAVTDIMASFKTISADGNFEIRNLMRANDAQPQQVMAAVIEHDLHHRMPGRIDAGDVIEFS